ncbi:MAG TPA: 50S ribosomal protein L23 [Deltaproteobacteria bacterium]|jgi:large subunit ribosomal protein L23|nr:50S ribosomal protein L23 [Deltaproteobacteria bacterium]NMD41234.1 50S ribosomal protein L23 [Deltaproteobacteria bacterium]HNQ86420.1 50S ribosomal protein L23 [Deltaproteobacteria bacterium]HNS90635.1 50S ribosomal protein L23 [Deltaproteobacteria bacterium]HOA45465.1 50S ribosomal protein L23 [Deltaproteobacteria bacterium]
MKTAHSILRRPLVTEKGTMLREKGNHVIFSVARGANKIEIKKAVEALFNVHVENVRTMNMKGKTKRWGLRHYERADWKKAIVTLREGETIELYEGV